MTTETIIDTFKQRARNGECNTFADHIIYSIARAIQYSESEGEANYLSTKYVLRMVSPVNQRSADCQFNGNRYGKLKASLRYMASHFGSIARPEVAPGMKFQGNMWGLGNVNLIDYKTISPKLAKQISDYCWRLVEAVERHYVYIFVRQDMIFEQQAVQAAHATMKAGAKLAGKRYGGKLFNPNTTHFVLIGVPDMGALIDVEAMADRNGIQGSMFYEEDLNGEPTAFCTDVVTHDQRSTFREYGLLKMRQPNTLGRRIGKKIDQVVDDIIEKVK